MVVTRLWYGTGRMISGKANSSMSIFGDRNRHRTGHKLLKSPPGARLGGKAGHAVKTNWQNVFDDQKARANLFGKQKGKAKKKK